MLRSVFVATCLSLVATAAWAQVTPAAGFTPPDDTPVIRIGTTMYLNFTDQTQPTVVDGDANNVTKTSFDVARAYINVTGNISHIVAFRFTPDISRENNPAASLAGSLELRVKYAYLQANLDDWMPRGSYVRFGIQQTPYLDYTEGIYRYRFQGTMFVERVGYFASADAGASFHYNLPSNYGDIHVGIFNGENYNKPEVNDQKSIMIRASLRPFATMDPMMRGLRITGYYDADNYVKSDERKRAIGQVTYEHKYVNMGAEFISARDQAAAIATDVKSKGYSIWATPKVPQANGSSVEALLRHDHWVPNDFNDQKQNRTIVGVAYWFPHQGNVSSALMLDYDGQSFTDIATTPNHSVAIHALINY